jgi:4-amino-4-deoxy-L-arabinose transferase-like glycosyltransferase
VAAAVRAHPWSSALVALAAIALAWRLLIAYTFPPYTWDGLAYHLTAVAGWLQDERIGANQLHIYASTFPMNGELVGAWLTLFHKTDTWVDAFQMPFAIIGAIAVAGLARVAGAGKPAAVAAACLFVLSPIVQTQATAEYVDLFVAALFLASLYLLLRAMRPESWSVVYLVLAGCAAGLAVGGKPTGPLFLLALLVSLGAGLLITRRRGSGSSTRTVAPVISFLVPVLALSGFWYARDAVEHSNPIYPARVELASEVVLRGPGMTQMAPPGTISQRVAVVRSWTHDFTRLFHSTADRYHEYGEVQGGMGSVWLLLGLPLLAVLVVQVARRRSALFWTLLVPLGLLFALQPYRWWSRFTIVLLAPGLVALVVVLERSRRGRCGSPSNP